MTLEEKLVWDELATDLGFTEEEITNDVADSRVDVEATLSILCDKGLAYKAEGRYFANRLLSPLDAF